MKIAIVVNAYIRNKSQLKQAERVCEELKALGTYCDIIKNTGLAEIKGGNILSSFNYDICVFLDKDKAAARLLEKSGLKLINSAEAIEVCDDKILTHIALSNCGISMPDTVYAPLCYYSDAEINTDYLDCVAEKLRFPMVAKLCYGSLGAGVTLIKNKHELFEYENANKLKAHFYQKFIGKGGEDIRAIVIGGKFICAMRRINEKDFRSNVELGGHGEKIIADHNLIKLCEITALKLNLDYCGIDILTDEVGRRYVCEVNSNAFFAEAERICGVNIAKKFAELIITK